MVSSNYAASDWPWKNIAILVAAIDANQ